MTPRASPRRRASLPIVVLLFAASIQSCNTTRAPRITTPQAQYGWQQQPPQQQQAGGRLGGTTPWANNQQPQRRRRQLLTSRLALNEDYDSPKKVGPLPWDESTPSPSLPPPVLTERSDSPRTPRTPRAPRAPAESPSQQPPPPSITEHPPILDEEGSAHNSTTDRVANSTSTQLAPLSPTRLHVNASNEQDAHNASAGVATPASASAQLEGLAASGDNHMIKSGVDALRNRTTIQLSNRSGTLNERVDDDRPVAALSTEDTAQVSTEAIAQSTDAFDETGSSRRWIVLAGLVLSTVAVANLLRRMARADLESGAHSSLALGASSVELVRNSNGNGRVNKNSTTHPEP